MRKYLLLAAVAALGVVGCAKKTMTPTANSSITEVAPPPPIHNGITAAQPIAYAEPIAAPMDDVAPVRGSSGGAGKTYIVKKGDTLWAIANRSYGDGKQYRKIVAANPNIKGDHLVVGQKIVIPS